MPAMAGMMPPQQPQMITVHDCRIKRVTETGSCKLRCIPLEKFLIDPDATNEEDATLIGCVEEMRKSDLIAMGHDRDKVMGLPNQDMSDTDAEEYTRRRGANSLDNDDDLGDELQEIDYYDLLVRLDTDDDGIVELHRLCFGGSISEDSLLSHEYWDEIDYAILTVKRRPHQWEGVSLSDDLLDIQKQKTVLVRQTLDNLYAQNVPDTFAVADAFTQDSIAQVGKKSFGKVFWLNQGHSASEAIEYSTTPFTADKSFSMLES